MAVEAHIVTKNKNPLKLPAIQYTILLLFTVYCIQNMVCALQDCDPEKLAQVNVFMLSSRSTVLKNRLFENKFSTT